MSTLVFLVSIWRFISTQFFKNRKILDEEKKLTLKPNYPTELESCLPQIKFRIRL